MTGVPFLILGLLLVLSAFAGAQVTGPRRGAIATFLLSPLHPATWRATGAILAGFWVELLAFSLIIGTLSSGGSTLLFGIGFVFIGLAVEGARLFARLERRRAMIADPRPLGPHRYRPYGHGLRDLALAVFVDPSRWRDVIYVLVALPLVILEFTALVVLWAASLWLLSLPVWAATGTLPFGTDGMPAGTSAAIALAGGLAGVVLAMVSASVSQGLMALHRAVIAGLLCESEQQQLMHRVETLEVSRRAVIDEEATELRRIERDLHDGAQQRLVALTIDLSMAADRIESDPAAARALVVGAQDQARQALAELRDLVRGIAPAILLDRGLVAALSALAGRSPVPTVVESTLPEGQRLSDATERAAYFVVAEALANVAKHASATRCEVRIKRDGDNLVLEIRDDGVGGARVLPAGGLAGLSGRVAGLDGSLTIQSPPGGPTVVRAGIPVGSVPAASPPPPMADGAIPGWIPPGREPD